MRERGRETGREGWREIQARALEHRHNTRAAAADTIPADEEDAAESVNQGCSQEMLFALAN